MWLDVSTYEKSGHAKLWQDPAAAPGMGPGGRTAKLPKAGRGRAWVGQGAAACTDHGASSGRWEAIRERAQERAQRLQPLSHAGGAWGAA